MSKNNTIFVAVTNDVSTDYRVHKVCSYLIQKGFKVVVYGRVLPDTFMVERAYKIVRKKHFFNHNFLFYAEYNFRLFCYVLFKKYDIILSNDLDTLPACFLANKLKSSELVYDSHELFSEGPELQGRNFVQNFWRKLENFLLPKVKKSYTVSQSIVDFYDQKYENKMGLIRNIPELNSFQIQEKVSFPTTKRTILYQGVLNPGRGLELMIKALKFIDNLDLIIIGFGKTAEELKQFVLTQKMEQRVHFLGKIPREKLANYTKIATLGMVLEEPLGKSFEFSLPNKLFDYIHAELPIISGNLVEISNIINMYKVGVIIDEYTPENIAKKINETLNNPTLISEIKSNQKKARKILCWEEEAKKLDCYFDV